MTRGFDPLPAALALHQARQARSVVSLPTTIAPQDEAEGVAVQHALARHVGIAQPPGFKIGATGARMQAYLGLPGPAGGFMAGAGIHASGASLRFADYVRPGLECELAVRLAHDLPPGPCTQDQAMAAVGELMAGIELVDNRYGAVDTLHMPTMMADQVFHSAAILGTPAPANWRNWDLTTIAGRILVDGVARDNGMGGDLLGHPMRGLAWLASSALAAAFGGLKAGQVVMLGSVTPPVWLDGPARARVEFAGLSAVELSLG
ncbi:MAG: hydratase [Acetobacteraceae bacterium]|nr:hydratase [Acetobacteraceae bacterium]